MSDSEHRIANNGRRVFHWIHPRSIQMPIGHTLLRRSKHFGAEWVWKMTRKATWHYFGRFTPSEGITAIPYPRTIETQPVTSVCRDAGSVAGRDHTSSAQLKTSTWAIDNGCLRSLETDRESGWIYIPLNWNECPFCWGPSPFERFVSVTRKGDNKIRLLVPCPWVSFAQLNAAPLVLHPMYHIS